MSFGQKVIFVVKIFDVNPQLIFLLYVQSDWGLSGLQELFKFIVFFDLNKLNIRVICWIWNKFLRKFIN